MGTLPRSRSQLEIKAQCDLNSMKSIPILQDTRTLIVKELFNVEMSYVESLQFLMTVRTKCHIRYSCHGHYLLISCRSTTNRSSPRRSLQPSCRAFSSTTSSFRSSLLDLNHICIVSHTPEILPNLPFCHRYPRFSGITSHSSRISRSGWRVGTPSTPSATGSWIRWVTIVASFQM